MRTLARVIGVVVMVIGALALVTPAQFIALGDSILTPAGMYAIAAIRVLVGLLLFVAAPASRAPTVLRGGPARAGRVAHRDRRRAHLSPGRQTRRVGRQGAHTEFTRRRAS